MSDAKITTIYALCDPDTQDVRYIGKTMRNAERRLYEHIQYSSRLKSHKNHWIQGLLAAGKSPLMKILEVVNDDWQEAERRWIAHYRRAALELTNVSNGGDGSQGFVHSENARLAISNALKSRVRSPESAAKIAESLKGRQRPADVRAKLADATREHFQSDERRSLQSQRLKEYFSNPEHLQKMKDSLRNKPPVSNETRSRISEAGKRRYSSQAERDRQSIRTKEAYQDDRRRKETGASSAKAWADPVAREARIAAMKLACNTPEARAQRSMAAKVRWAKAKGQTAAKDDQ